ncbi:G-box-binding factor 1-like [Cucumis melo var. makuwa]|uniref:G-box-binding factor 1-like n=1 Tax=Cucumis melo var. makuwa TaxID=1194695 RepID=A0A5A7U079_CUCMM|nr:G-box-binding factor 1-like [Cucumis melo var. makuwa]TYK09364.1 G-box-binding factor 1-like [Cucumis melo var. makuwa]
MLPVSDPPRSTEEKDRLIRGDEKLSRGSSMTKRGAYVALSYTAYRCAKRWDVVLEENVPYVLPKAYYSAGATPPPFFASTIASPTPHPYIWGGQHPLMLPYGTPVPYPAIYHYGNTASAGGRKSGKVWLQVLEMIVLLKGPVNESGSSSREPNAKA